MAAQTALAELREEAHTSVSAITTYIQCPKKYELSYLQRVPPSHRPVALSLGAALHQALALFYSHIRSTDSEMSKSELVEHFSRAWKAQLESPVPTLLDDKETEKSVEEKGAALLGAFHDLAPRPHRVIEIEMPFSVELVNPDSGEVLPVRMVGVFDAVVQDADGKYTILEHKSAARRWSEDRLAFDHQLTCYTLAGTACGLGDVRVSVQLLLKQKVPTLEIYQPTRTDDDRRDFLRLVCGVLKAIEANAFWAKRDWFCRTCPWAGPCLTG